ncbi:MAG: hypothetical protein R2746_08460 [Acidimicrobiales bacterium]|nr:hypothetical protein [Actinomycetota bacterium]
MSSTSAAERWSSPVLIRFAHRHLWSAPRRTPGEHVVHQRRAFERAGYLVRLFYAFSFLWVIEQMYMWRTLLDVREMNPLWPARWLHHVDLHTGVKVALVFYLLAALAVLAFPELRIFRFLYAVGLLEFMAMVNSPTKINHNLHAWLYCAFIFVLLPNGPWRRRRGIMERYRFLSVVWTAQLAVLFAYTLTGVWKVVEALFAVRDGRVGGFHPSGFSYTVADRLLRTDAQTLIGPFFATHELPGWALFVGTMYLETCSIVVAFRPRLHKVWGLGLIAFHLGTQVVMGFTFNQNVALLALLFVFSPFSPEEFVVKDVLLDLPGVHIVAKRWARRGRGSPPEAIVAHEEPVEAPT